MEKRVEPFAEATGARTPPDGSGPSSAEWDAMSAKEKYRLNDGMLRARIREGDDFATSAWTTDRIQCGPSSISRVLSSLRLDERGVSYETVSQDEVLKTIGRR